MKGYDARAAKRIALNVQSQVAMSADVGMKLIIMLPHQSSTPSLKAALALLSQRQDAVQHNAHAKTDAYCPANGQCTMWLLLLAQGIAVRAISMQEPKSHDRVFALCASGEA